MKKHLFLLPLLLLAISGCSEAHDPTNSGSTSGSGIIPPGGIEEKIQDFLNLSECQISVDMEVTMPGTMFGVPISPSVTIYIPTNHSVQHETSLVYAKFPSSYVDYSNSNSVEKTYFMYDEVEPVLQTSGMTIDDLKAIGESLPEDVGTIEFHDDERYAIYTQSNLRETYSGSAIAYDEEIQQYKMADFVNGKVVRAEYVSRYELENDVGGQSHDIGQILQNHISEITLKDGLYSVDLSAEPYASGEAVFTKVGFSFTETTYHIELDGYTDGVGERITYHQILDLHHLGNMEYSIPTFEVKCPFHHSCHRYEKCDVDHHILTCSYCGRIIDGAQPIEHTMNEDYNICLVCDEYVSPIGMSHFSDDRLDIGQNNTTLSGYLGKNGKLYDAHVGNTGFNADIDTTMYEGSRVYYWMEPEIMIIEDQNSPTVLGDSEWRQQITTYHCYKGFPDLLTPAQKQDLIDHRTNRGYVETTLISIFDFPATHSAFLSRFNDQLLVTYNSYRLIRSHDFEHEVLVEVNYPDECFYGTYYTCPDCGQMLSNQAKYHHDVTYTQIETPSWGNSNACWYFTVSDCHHCGESCGAIYQVGVGIYHELSCSANLYFDNGNFYPNDITTLTDLSIPHYDSDRDGRCDLCGAYRLAYTYENVEYVIYYRYGQCVSSNAYWTNTEANVYRNVANQDVIMTIMIEDTEENLIYRYSINGGAEQTVSEPTPLKV